MSIDTDEMVRMAKTYGSWSLQGYGSLDAYFGAIRSNPESNGQTVWMWTDREAWFVERCPATILALSERVATLEAQNATLQARVDALGEWLHPHAELPPMTDGYRSEIVVVATEAQYHYKENRWILNSEPFGWKAQLPDPDESPTAAAVAESESEE